MKKRVVSILLIAAMTASLAAGCGKPSGSESGNSCSEAGSGGEE